MPAPPFASRSAAAANLASEYPEHGPHVRVGTGELEDLSQRLLAKREEYRRLSLEVAALECALKRKIGLFRGLRVASGTWFWEKKRPKKRVDWLGLVEELRIPHKAVEKHSYRPAPMRLLRFVRAKEALWKTKKR